MTEDKLSKSARKREALALQSLGSRLLKLNAEQIKSIPISVDLSDAIQTYHRINSREAKRRQSQYIGRLMRTEDFQSISDILGDLQQTSASAQYKHHMIESWREKLLKDPQMLTDYLNEHPNTDIQALRILLKHARSLEKRHLRELFRFLRNNEPGEDFNE